MEKSAYESCLPACRRPPKMALQTDVVGDHDHLGWWAKFLPSGTVVKPKSARLSL
jgi:hypothetical protein